MPAPTVSPEMLTLSPALSAVSYQTPEYYRQPGLAMVGASTAWSTGATGQGVVVAVNDGQIDTGISELSGRIAPRGVNYIGDATPDDHGTHLAGTIAANRDGTGMEGVAWSSRILPIASFDTNNYSSTDAPYRGIRYAADNGAAIINNSWGSSPDASIPSGLVSAVRYATGRGAIVVFSTGNAGASQPNATVMVPTADSATAGRVVAVTALDTAGLRASYANACGRAADWCLAAPGRIYSTSVDEGYQYMSGTSMAAAMVSGGLAVVKSRFPELSSDQIVTRLLTTANGTGIYADSSIYGHGLMDLAAATRPVGTLVPLAIGASTAGLSEGGAASPLSAAFAGGGVAGESLGRALRDIDFAVFDSFDGATFDVSGGDLVAPARSAVLSDFAFGDFAAGWFAEVIEGQGYSLSLTERSSPAGAMAALGGADPLRRETSAVLRYALDDRTTMVSGLRASLAEVLPGADGLRGEAGLSLIPDARVPGVLALADGGSVFGLEHVMPSGATVSLAFMQGDESKGDLDVTSGATRAVELTLRREVGLGFGLQVGLGYLTEDGSLLGTEGGGALALGRADTLQLSLGASKALGKRVTLYARYDRATTDGAGAGAFVDGVDRLDSESWRLGVVARDLRRAGDRWGFGVYQPPRIDGGQLQLAVPTGRLADGTVIGRAVDVGLDGGGRELDWEAFWATPLSRRALLGVNMVYVTDPGHSETAEDGYVVMMRLRRQW